MRKPAQEEWAQEERAPLSPFAAETEQTSCKHSVNATFPHLHTLPRDGWSRLSKGRDGQKTVSCTIHTQKTWKWISLTLIALKRWMWCSCTIWDEGGFYCLSWDPSRRSKAAWLKVTVIAICPPHHSLSKQLNTGTWTLSFPEMVFKRALNLRCLQKDLLSEWIWVFYLLTGIWSITFYCSLQLSSSKKVNS